MQKTIRHHLLASLLAASAIIGLSPTAQAATSNVSTVLDLNIDFVGATFLGGPNIGGQATVFDDFDVDPDGYWITFAGNFINTGTGTTSSNGSMTSGGVPPDANDEFAYFPNDSIVMHLMADASATGAGSNYLGNVEGEAVIGFQNYGSHDLSLTFGFNWMRNITAANDIAGSHAVGLLDATASAERNTGSIETFQFIDGNAGYNIGTSVTAPFNFDDGDTGVITLTLPANEYVAVTFNATLGAWAQVSAVPEADTWAMMLAGLGLLGAIGRRRLNAAA